MEKDCPRKVLKTIVIYSIKRYQTIISPLKPSCCRYYPTCSAYAIKAIEKYGIIKGVYLSLKRILKCNPFFSGGYDPI